MGSGDAVAAKVATAREAVYAVSLRHLLSHADTRFCFLYYNYTPKREVLPLASTQGRCDEPKEVFTEPAEEGEIHRHRGGNT